MKEKRLCKWFAQMALILTLGQGSIALADDTKDKMEGMDMNKMHMMMKECMSKQEDDKMCHREILDKCAAKMSAKECQSLMNNMKKHKDSKH